MGRWNREEEKTGRRIEYHSHTLTSHHFTLHATTVLHPSAPPTLTHSALPSLSPQASSPHPPITHSQQSFLPSTSTHTLSQQSCSSAALPPTHTHNNLAPPLHFHPHTLTTILFLPCTSTHTLTITLLLPSTSTHTHSQQSCSSPALPPTHTTILLLPSTSTHTHTHNNLSPLLHFLSPAPLTTILLLPCFQYVCM